MKNFLRLLNYARPWRRFWPGYIILAVLSVIFGIVNYSLISPVLRLLFESPTNEQVSAEISALADKTREFSMSMDWFEDTFQYYMDKIFLANGPLKALLFVCALLVGASLLSNITRYLSQTILVRMRTHIMKKLRTDLFRKVSTMDVGFYHTQQKGDIISRISNDVTEVQTGVAASFHMIFIGFISYCFYLSPKLTLVTLVTIPLSGLAIGALSKRLRKKAIETQSLMGRIVSHFDEAISGIRIIKGFNAQKYVQENFEQTNEAHKKSSRKMLYRQQLAHPTSEFLGITIAAAVLLYGGWLQINGSLGLSMGTFTVYILCYWRVLEPAKNIAKAYASIQRGLVSGERLFVILDAENQIKEKDDAKTLKEFKSGIEYR